MGAPTLMQSQQSVGTDLPQKFLTWQDENGQVHITYIEPQYIAQRHGVQGQDATLGTIMGALSSIAGAAGQ